MAQNTEQIIKALECCLECRIKKDDSACKECPSASADFALCGLMFSVRDIIVLISDHQEQKDKNKELQAHNENLKKENQYLRESLADEREHKEDMEGTK